MLSENRARTIVDVRGGWRKLHSEELYDFYPLPDGQKNSIKVIKQRKVRMAGSVPRVEDMRNTLLLF
jgi:hypothetical protein